MGRLLINPTELINVKRSMITTCDDINQSYSAVMQGWNDLYEGVKKRSTINTSVGKLISEFGNRINYIENIVNELIEATGFSEDELLSGNYDEEFYEKKIYGYYFDKYYLDGTILKESEYISHFILTNPDNQTFKKYKGAKIFIDNNIDFFNKFRYQDFKLDKYDVAFDLIYIRDKRGDAYLQEVKFGLLNNCPANYVDVVDEFHPKIVDGTKIDAFDSTKIGSYIVNIDKILINGEEYKFVQSLPGDCTDIESLLYNFAKVNVINTMRSLPSDYMKSTGAGGRSDNAIILTCDSKLSNPKYVRKYGWSGVYSSVSDSPTPPKQILADVIFIDARSSFISNDFITRDTVIHELGHRFDAITLGENYGEIIKWYTPEFDKLIVGLLKDGYKSHENIKEFFADLMVVYLTKGDELKAVNEELYNIITAMFNGTDYGNYYSNNVNKVIYKIGNGQ